MKTNHNKIIGGPAQNFYRKLLKKEGAGVQADLVKHLQQKLNQNEISLHPRTIKRQLNGTIQYIPEILEQLLLKYVRGHFPSTYRQLKTSYDKEKLLLESKAVPSFYVPREYFEKMVLGYLFKHKELNHRQLALKIHQDLIDKKSPIHLETIIAVLNGKTKRVRKILQDQLEAYFQQEGLKDRQDIQKYLLQQAQIEKNKGENYSWNQLISSTQVIQTVSDLLTKYQSLTRRQLAIQLKEDLGKENLHYSLSTLQWILGGKNQKVKAIIKKYLDLYLNEDKFFRPREEPTNLEVKRGGRPSYTQKLTKIYEQVQTASAENRGALFREFMDLREKFIKKRWLLKHPVVSPLYSTSGESENFKEEENWKEEPCNLNPDTIWMDRLVS